MNMTRPKRAPSGIDGLMERASQALVETRYFECERLSLEALRLAHSVGDYERMARILMPLQEARRQKRLAAVDAGKIRVINAVIPEDQPIERGVYLIEPPLVGANGRDLRDRAEEQGVPVVVLVREPTTRTGQWPVVMVGPVTVRTKVTPPPHDKPTLEWVQAASEALGDAAIAEVDPSDEVFIRVDELLSYLGTVTDHEKLHQTLEAACREAAAEVARGGSSAASKRKPKSAAPDPDEEADDDES